MFKSSALTMAIVLIFSMASRAQSETVIISTLPQVGFLPSDFEKATLSVVVYWYGESRFPNLNAYWTQKNEWCDGDICAAEGDIKKAFEEPKTGFDIQNSESPFLKSSELVNTDNPIVKKIVQNARPFVHSPEELIAAISREIHAVLYFPDKEGGLPLRTTDEILKSGVNGKFVAECKSFSNIFVAVARGLGIPARMVSGYVLSKVGPLGHMWAEIRLNDGSWQPVDLLISDRFHVPEEIQIESLSESGSRGSSPIAGFKKGI